MCIVYLIYIFRNKLVLDENVFTHKLNLSFVYLCLMLIKRERVFRCRFDVSIYIIIILGSFGYTHLQIHVHMSKILYLYKLKDI